MGFNITARMLASTAAAFVLLSAASAGAAAQSLKIGYVNSEKVLRDSAPARAAQTKLEAEFSKRERDLVELRNKIKSAAEQLDRYALTIPESERARRQRELVDQDRDLQRRQREFQEDLNLRKNEELATVVERANRVIRQIFESENYDLILQEVVFAGPRVDITDKVIRALNGPAK